jgi:zinc protease
MCPRAIAAAAAVAAGAHAAHAAPAVPVERYTLASGLEVVLAPDPSVTSTIVEVWYRVGSKDEAPGRTGLAHLFEHLMFAGSRHARAGDFDRLIEAAGGWDNAETDEDHTAYVEQVPGRELELALWLEADRMIWLGPELTQDALDHQRAVIASERREAYDDQPYGAAELLVPEALWPAGHGNHHPVFGAPAELAAASLDDVTRFWLRYYAPSNAVLVVCGGFDPDRARRLVATYFDALPLVPRPTAAAPIAPIAPLAAPVTRATTDRVSVPEVVMAWRADRPYTETSADLEVAAHLLGGGKTSRLYRRLVARDHLAAEVYVTHEPHLLGGQIEVHAIAERGVGAARLRRALAAELARFRRAPGTADELARARTALRAERLFSLENLATRANALAAWDALTGDPDFLGKEDALLAGVTSARLAATVRRWLAASAAVTITVTPARRGAR